MAAWIPFADQPNESIFIITHTNEDEKQFRHGGKFKSSLVQKQCRSVISDDFASSSYDQGESEEGGIPT